MALEQNWKDIGILAQTDVTISYSWKSPPGVDADPVWKLFWFSFEKVSCVFGNERWPESALGWIFPWLCIKCWLVFEGRGLLWSFSSLTTQLSLCVLVFSAFGAKLAKTWWKKLTLKCTSLSVSPNWSTACFYCCCSMASHQRIGFAMTKPGTYFHGCPHIPRLGFSPCLLWTQ